VKEKFKWLPEKSKSVKWYRTPAVFAVFRQDASGYKHAKAHHSRCGAQKRS
jgi:hypothetical protein